MNEELKKLSIKKESTTSLRLQWGEYSRAIEVYEVNEPCVDLICEIINEARHFRDDIVPASEEQFFRALNKLCGSTFPRMSHVTFDMDCLADVIGNIQFNGKLSVIFFLPILISRLEVPVEESNS